MSKKTGLGKGLSALIPDSLSDQETSLISQNKGEKDTLTAFGSELRQVPSVSYTHLTLPTTPYV